MKKVFATLLLLTVGAVKAQSPKLNVKGQDSLNVRMNQMFVDVKIIGNIAYTTTEMHFVNSGSRDMEGELLFPLPEGVSVSRFALDINGKMREAVPVNKNKGKQVFEAIQHRRVDPGLLEKVDGNNFKTRIFPISPNKERIVIIGYEQELSDYEKNSAAYQLVSKYANKLDKYEISVNVTAGNVTPLLIKDNKAASPMEQMTEMSGSKSYAYSIKKLNYQPSENFLIKIPKQSEVPDVFVQSLGDQYYFYVNATVESSKIRKQAPGSIGLVWDNSLSCQGRDLDKELNFLEGYFKEVKNTTVTLYLLNYTFEKKKDYVITNGDWSALKAALQAVQYDGGTRFSKMKLAGNDEYFFFTDGISSLSDNELQKIKKPIYTISSLVSSDYALLNYTAAKSGGDFINLNQLSVEKALEKALYQHLKFLGIKENFSVVETYPGVGTTVAGSFSASGISLKPKNEVVLLFGYGDKPVMEKKVVLNAEDKATLPVNIERIWAQKKLASLEIQSAKNASEIETLGKRYGIVTRNTSLIVLEDVNDYILYDITPPQELREQYDVLMKQRGEQAKATKKDNWKQIENYYNELATWWNKDIKYSAPKPLPKPKATTSTRPSGSAGRVTGVVTEGGVPIPGVSVVIKGTNRGVQTDFDGVYSINAQRGETLVFSYLGMHNKEVVVRNANNYNVTMEAASSSLEEVVVMSSAPTSDGTKAADAQEDVQEVHKGEADSNDEIEERPGVQLVARAQGIRVTSSVQTVQGRTIESRLDGSVMTDTLASGRISNRNLNWAETKTKAWNPDRVYLKAMDAAPKEKRYALYLELRKEQLNNPSFYFDVANYFYNDGEKQKALLILSNIADLSLENHQLYKSLVYQLRQWEEYEDALFVAQKVAKWREHEPQSYRDLALTLEDNKKYQEAFDALLKALNVSYYEEMSGQYDGIEDIILMDINRMLSEHKGINDNELEDTFKSKLPVAVRIILNWNQMDTDIDLHIIEPTGEECYYGKRTTEAGARFSKDFTQGYGPEQYLLRNKVKGKFIIKTNFYGERTLTQTGPATVMVEIYTTGKDGKTERKLQTIQLGKVKQNENLAEIIVE
ncbi:VIT domain-containing protein [Flavobacterium pedocola]